MTGYQSTADSLTREVSSTAVTVDHVTARERAFYDSAYPGIIGREHPVDLVET